MGSEAAAQRSRTRKPTMSNDDFELSRRKALAALGTIGVASAGAGLGTSAYFSDQETFENNRLVAGELDLVMDWEEHYSDWSADEGEGLDISMEEPQNTEGYRRFPVGATDQTVGDHALWVADEDVTQFMLNTSIDAFPDTVPDPDGDGTAEFPPDQIACETLADVGGDDDGLSSPARSDNEYTDPGDPLINLQDVKPGDFGEVTFSTHLCFNDGYLWLNAPDGCTFSENGTTEPEADDPDEVEGEVELADTVQTALWYDNNCNNLPDEEIEPVDLMVVVDTSGSITEDDMNEIKAAANTFAQELPDDGTVQTGLMEFSGYQEGGTPNPVEVLADLGPVGRFTGGDPALTPPGDLLPDSGDGNTAMPGALDLARAILNDSANNAGRDDARKVILLISDGAPDYADDANDGNLGDGYVQYDATHDGTTYVSNEFAAGGTSNFSTQEEKDETAALASDIHTGPTGYSGNPLHQNDFDGENGVDILAVGVTPNPGDPLNAYLQNRIATTPNDFYSTEFGPDLQETAEQIVDDLVVTGEGEEVFFTGTLGELCTELTANDGRGIPLDGDRGSSFDEFGDPENADSRQCFDASATHCFGFSWWVPLDHGNEIQSDGVQFDIGFYTEQCRHNDGSGMNNAQVTPGETDA
jgi:predicted ribosomally synthesized peptide with SipW-like signal peptide